MRYVYDLSAVQLEIEQGILSHQAKVMQKCILHNERERERDIVRETVREREGDRQSEKKEIEKEREITERRVRETISYKMKRNI